MKRSALALAVSLTLVFLSGLAVGAIGYRLYKAESGRTQSRRPSPEEYRTRYTEMLKSRLKLSEDQVQQLNVILDETRKRFEELEAKTEPEWKAIKEQQHEETYAILDEEQRAEFTKFRQEHAERKKRSEGRKGSPPPQRHKGGPRR